MKKLFLFSILSIFTIGGIHAQGNFEASANVGLIVGDASDFFSFKAGIAVAYLFEVSDEFQVGPEIGYDNYFAKDFSAGGITFKTDDVGVVPILAKAKYSLSDRINAHVGVGYAVFTGDGDGGEFTWKLGGSYEFTEDWEAGVGYNSINGDGGEYAAGINMMISATF